MGYLGRKHSLKASTNAPPDVSNPPFYIPVKPIANRYALMQELGNGSFGTVTLAKLLSAQDGRKAENRNADHNAELLAATRQQYHNTLMDDANVPDVDQENYHNKQRGVLAIKTMMTRLPTLNDYTRVREVKFILSMPAHRNLVQIWELFIDDVNYQLHIVMECMEQNLYQLMRARRKRVFSLPSLKSILTQLITGIRHIHSHNFFHRDLKPENILISPSNHYFSKDWILNGNYSDNYVVKIADYGLARHVTNKSPYTAYVSTRWYRSPEILLRKGSYSRPLDIWAFGCVVVEVATFRPLFPGSDEMDQIWKILEVLGTPHTMSESAISGYQPHGGSWEKAEVLASRLNLKFPYVEGTSIESIVANPHLQELCEVVKECLTWDPKKRATVDEICAMPYFAETGGEQLGTEMLVQHQAAGHHVNDENESKFAEIHHHWASKVFDKKRAKNQNQNQQKLPLEPLELDSNSGHFKNSKGAHLSFKQFLNESASPDSELSSHASSVEIGKPEQDSKRDTSDVIGPPLSRDLGHELALSSSLQNAEDGNALEPPEIEES